VRVCSRSSALGAVVALVALPGVLFAQPAVRRQEPATLPARLQAPARAAIERLADSLQRAGLPVEPLYAKAAEGVLKGADDTRIVTVVQSLARELGDASAALGATATSAELVAGASALHAGVPSDALRQLRRARDAERLQPGALAVPIVVLADLVTRRVPADVAAQSVAALVSRRAPDAEMASLRSSVEQDIGAGQAPAAALQARTRSLVRSLDAQQPARAVPASPIKPPEPPGA
jgi:hypothetical protein